jgi:putative SOS response-associated peptidase YedK
MCGRYIRRGSAEKVAQWFDIQPEDLPVFGPSYNVAPQSTQPVVRLNVDRDRQELALMRWDLIPFWSRDAKIAYSTINAKAESIATSPAFREAFKHRRCLIPADGFYEWAKIDAKTRQPYALGLKNGGLIAFAGLWETWKDKATGQSLQTFTIITTNPNELVKPADGPTLHDRMPVIVRREDYLRWLEPAQPGQLPVDLLRPYPAEEMTAWKVSAAVGNVRNDVAELINPI